MKTRLKVITTSSLVSLLLFFTSCEIIKPYEEELKEDGKDPARELVYAAGTYQISNFSQQQITMPIYWINGVPKAIKTSYYTAVASIFVSDNDVYLCGSEASGAVVYYSPNDPKLIKGKENAVNAREYVPVIWKNGEKSKLSEKGGHVSSIYVVGTDVYATGWMTKSGSSEEIPVYWKNGTSYELPTIGNAAVTTTDIFVSGSDVYISGYSFDSKFGIYWKNGVATKILPEKAYHYILINSINVKNGDVYLAGTENNTVKYWKNGVGTLLDTNDTGLSVQLTDNNDLFVVSKMKYWKNGIPTDFEQPIPSKTSVFFSGDNVYQVYSGRIDGKYKTGYKKNNEFFPLELPEELQEKHYAECMHVVVVKK